MAPELGCDTKGDSSGFLELLSIEFDGNKTIFSTGKEGIFDRGIPIMLCVNFACYLSLTLVVGILRKVPSINNALNIIFFKITMFFFALLLKIFLFPVQTFNCQFKAKQSQFPPQLAFENNVCVQALLKLIFNPKTLSKSSGQSLHDQLVFA